MHNKLTLIKQLADMGLQRNDTILIHSSMKAIGNVDGGADTVLDALQEYFCDGLLLLPTHTWAIINSENPVFDPKTQDSCVGILPNLFYKRSGVIRSLHPTHSIAAYGKNARQYVEGEENCNTPCTPGGCYDKLRYVNGKILLIGVTHARNTYIHGIEEVLNVPNRLADKPMELYIVMPDGSKKKIYMRSHFNAVQPHISEEYIKLEQAFYDCDAAKKAAFGDAECILCDAAGVFNVTRHILAPKPECLLTEEVISPERWRDM